METTFGAFLMLMSFGVLWQFIPGLLDRKIIRNAISAVVLNVFLPALSFHVLYYAPLNNEIWIIPLVSFVVCLTTLMIAWLIYKLIFHFLRGKFSKESVGALLLGAAWCNATYLGLPIITMLFGEKFARIPILYDLLALTPLLLTVGAWIGAFYGQDLDRINSHLNITGGAVLENDESNVQHPASDRDNNKSRKDSSAIKALLKLPPLYGAIFGILFNLTGFSLPAVFLSACKLAGTAVAPMMIFSVGLALRFSSSITFFSVVPAVLLKLFFAPLVAYFTASFLGLTGEVLISTILEAGMPTMVLTMVICDRYNLNAELLAQCIAITTLLSFFTLPLIVQFLKT